MSRKPQPSARRSRRTTYRPFTTLFRLEELEPRVAPATHLFTVPGTNGVSTNLAFTLGNHEAVFNNEAGVYAVQDASGRVNGLLPGDPGYLQAALSSAQVLFRSGTPTGTEKDLSFAAGTQLAFYLVQNDTTANAQIRNPQDALAGGGPLVFFSLDGVNPDRFDHVHATQLTNGTGLFAWEDQTNGGDQDFNDMIFAVGTPAAAFGTVPGTAGQTISTVVTLQSRARFDNEMGVFLTDNVGGTVGGVNPGDPGYARAALSSATRQVIFSGPASPGGTATVNLPAGSTYGFYLIQDGTAANFLSANPNNDLGSKPLAFFSTATASPDHFDHFRWLPGNVMTWEDETGGGDQDFHDLVASVQFGPTAGTPPAQPVFDLDPGSDTNIPGDQQTSLGNVTLNGTTDPNVQVQLLQTSATTTADAAGKFSFGNVTLQNGPNPFTVVATNAAGLTSQFSRTITRVDTPPQVTATIPDVTLSAGGSRTLDLAGNFTDPDTLDTLVRADTSAGPINIELFDRQAPRTVANFLNYVTSGRYAESIFHRSAKLSDGTPFVLQGGGFTFNTNPSRLDPIAADPAVQNEADPANRSNLRGTLAMAKLGGDPNSATDQFFFNLGNNSANLDNQNGGFTVFGKVVGAADQQVVDNLAAIPTRNQGNAPALPPSEQGVFTEIPLQNYTGTNFPTDTTAANYALVTNFTVTRSTEALTYSATSSAPAVVGVSVVNNRLTLQATNQTGTATITVTATDRAGASVSTSFKVTVG
jgi:cyclophilin family peptidyl-prolyl cis-trans isomerase